MPGRTRWGRRRWLWLETQLPGYYTSHRRHRYCHIVIIFRILNFSSLLSYKSEFIYKTIISRIFSHPRPRVYTRAICLLCHYHHHHNFSVIILKISRIFPHPRPRVHPVPSNLPTRRKKLRRRRRDSCRVQWMVSSKLSWFLHSFFGTFLVLYGTFWFRTLSNFWYFSPKLLWTSMDGQNLFILFLFLVLLCSLLAFLYELIFILSRPNVECNGYILDPSLLVILDNSSF